jgi:hypothetical protein
VYIGTPSVIIMILRRPFRPPTKQSNSSNHLFFEFMGAPAQLLHSLSLHVASAIFSL